MRQILEAFGWLIVAIGTLITGALIYSLGYAILVPDTSGSPDARGMAHGLSVVGIILFGLPTSLIAWLLIQSSKKKPPQ